MPEYPMVTRKQFEEHEEDVASAKKRMGEEETAPPFIWRQKAVGEKQEKARIAREARQAQKDADRVERLAKADTLRAQRDQERRDGLTKADTDRAQSDLDRRARLDQTAANRASMDATRAARLAKTDQDRRDREARLDKEKVERAKEREKAKSAREIQFVTKRATTAGKELVKGLVKGAVSSAPGTVGRALPRGIRTKGYLPETPMGTGFDYSVIREKTDLPLLGFEGMYDTRMPETAEEDVLVAMDSTGNGGAPVSEILERSTGGFGKGGLLRALANLRRQSIIRIAPEYTTGRDTYYERVDDGR